MPSIYECENIGGMIDQARQSGVAGCPHAPDCSLKAIALPAGGIVFMGNCADNETKTPEERIFDQLAGIAGHVSQPDDQGIRDQLKREIQTYCQDVRERWLTPPDFFGQTWLKILIGNGRASGFIEINTSPYSAASLPLADITGTAKYLKAAGIGNNFHLKENLIFLERYALAGGVIVINGLKKSIAFQNGRVIPPDNPILHGKY